ncbi:MAG: hypothetical protein KF862_11745 [Chitinophagaceae bacterium]|nr:hypothetical protein [Chitinophagaceae bacterium]
MNQANNTYTNTYRDLFQNYVEGLAIPDSIRNKILSDVFLNQNPSFYFFYPKLFSDEFSVEERVIDDLCIAGYLYYEATLLTDSFIDEKRKDDFLTISVCQEETIKILTSHFGRDSFFWSLWNERKNEYIKGISIEKRMISSNIVETSEFELLADLKSALGKIAVDALYVLSEKKNSITYEKILKSHRSFSIAYQIYDDIKDIKEDYENGQFNFAYYNLSKKHSGLSIDEANKIFYIKGYAAELFRIGISYLDSALDEINTINLPLWKEHLFSTKSTFLKAIREINDYLEFLSSGIYLSITKKQMPYSTQIKIAKKFILTRQNDDGSWHEYSNQGGISDIWATAFITTKLDKKSFPSFSIKKALQFLNRNVSAIDLWGYNSTWICDADSTSLSILAFQLQCSEMEGLSYKNWLNFQNENGSFSTYNNEKELLSSLNDPQISNVKGWCNGHGCVSAVAFYNLALLKKYNKEFRKLYAYFNDPKNIKAYWWTSNIYTYYYLALTYKFIKEFAKLSEIVSFLLEIQNNNGSFSDNYGENLFYTGLALEILLLSPRKYLDNIEKCVAYINSAQFDDGSWENSNALLIPNPDENIIENKVREVGRLGVNIRSREFNRLFTTSTVLNSLELYGKR